MDLKNILKNDAEMILRKPVKHKIGDIEVEIKPLTVGQMTEILPYLTEIGGEDLTEMQTMIETFDYGKLPDMVSKFLIPIQKIIEVICGQTFEDVATFEDYFYLLAIILSKSGQLSFQKSIILMKNMSPSERTEIIAAHKFLTSLN